MKSISPFSFFLSTRIEFGIGKINQLHEYINQLQVKKVMIVTDKVLVDIGLINPILHILTDNHIGYYLFNEVEVDPTVALVDKAAQICINENCDVILAVGGGSSMDTAKGISVVASNGGSSYDYLDGRGETKKQIQEPVIPVIAVPTTSGTGSEVSQYAVITHNHVKDSISSALIYPVIAIIDADFTKNLPPFVTAYTGMDAFGHALEGYTSKIDNAFTNLFALEAMKLIFENLPACVNEKNIEARSNMAMAALLAGIAMSHCGATLPHAMGCPLSGHCQLPHGLTVGLLQVPMMEFNKQVLQHEFKQILNYIDPLTIHLTSEECANQFIQRVKTLMKEIHLKEKVKLENIDNNVIGNMIHDTMIHGCSGLNAREMTKEAVERIYREILE